MVFFTTFLKQRIWYIVFLLAVVYFLVLIRSDLVQNDKFARDKRELVGQIESEGAELAALKEKMRTLNKNYYLERVAREKLGLVKSGERAYKVLTK